MEEIQSFSDNYRSSSSSASSPIGRPPAGAFFYLRKPGTLRQPISFEDSPDWDDTEIDAHLEEVGDSIHIATATASPSLSKINSGSLPSPSLPEASTSVTARKIAGASIVWKELTVTLNEKGKYSDKVVKSSNGYALPGTLTVIMGPARSGKSTLLRAIAGKLQDPARMYGEVFVNGVKSCMPYGSYGYVDREDMLIESLTVREMLYYSALLQLPGFFFQKKSFVEDAISAMSLGDFADSLIGGHCYTKSLPSGERRRVSIAQELVMRPHVLFIDEPLYHLDSVSALLLMVTLKKLASTGCTLIFTMYQSSTEVFGLFDRICLLSNGNTLFFGETLACLQVNTSNLGFPCPIMQSPSDHFLRAINTDFDRIIAMCKNLQEDNSDLSSVNMDTAVAIRTLEATYKSSADSAAVESMIVKLIDKVRVAAVFSFISFILLLSVAGLPAHINEIKIFTHEESNEHSGPVVFLLGHLLSSIPFLFLVSITTALIFYFLVGMRNEFSLLMYFILNVMMMLVAGYLKIADALPGPVWKCPLSYVAFHTYAIEACNHPGLLENEYVGTSFAVGQVRAISGVQAVHASYDISPSRNAKWGNLLALFLMAVGYRILLFVLLRFKVRKNIVNCNFCCLKMNTTKSR
ncbi:ABC-2 type transporter [Musa troglodytarum]|uniref:ABC-2 type transporter n=1 Tax=Musa troglodytarum TaxID=320322 RepID=A0A9E7ESH3_9LILI|nr:ABC-2 type transporter [Musa troglodytarum]